LTADRKFKIIAHRGASGYLPEHTLEGVAMAHAMGVDYIEQDVLLTRDNVLIVLHDLYLDAVTDVAEKFPARQRPDGRRYAIDFTLEEIRSLRVHERLDTKGQPAFSGRFPPEDALFRVPTFAEEIALIQGLNRSTSRDIGVYVEPKSPAWHQGEGIDLVSEVVNALDHFGYKNRQDNAILQSFDRKALEHARHELQSDLKLVQLIGDNSWGESDTDFDFLQSCEGLESTAKLADGIGPWLPQVMNITEQKTPDISDLTTRAQQLELFVHAYTLRADQLPEEIGGMANATQFLARKVGLDGVFTDHPDQVISALG
jgi:glycerophosphoryl diester phosphodiesterase